jgi:hypothetical protein
MPVIHPKSPERIIAEVSEVASQLPHQPDRNFLLHQAGNASEMALRHTPDVIARVVTESEYTKDEEGNRVHIAAGAQRTIMTRQQYIDSLRHARRDSDRFYMIAGRAALLKQHNEHVRDAANSNATAPVYVAEGDAAIVEAYTLNSPVRHYARRKPKADYMPRHSSEPPVPPLADLDNHIVASLRTTSPIAERIKSFSFANGGETVAAYEPGKSIGDLSHDELQEVTYFQLQDLAIGVAQVKHDDVQLDILQKLENIHYDPTNGFTLLDLGVVTPDHTNYALNTPATFMRIGDFLANGKTGFRRLLHQEDYQEVARELQDRLPLIIGYQAACDALPAEAFGRQGQEAKAAVIAACDQLIAANRQKVLRYTDQEWAVDDIAHAVRTGRLRPKRY